MKLNYSQQIKIKSSLWEDLDRNMNIFIQNILVFTAVVLAVAFLVRKFFFKKNKKSCGDDDCGCH